MTSAMHDAVDDVEFVGVVRRKGRMNERCGGGRRRDK